jgi:starch synthase
MAHHGFAPKELLQFVGLYGHDWHPFVMKACGSVPVTKRTLQFANKNTIVHKTYAENINTADHGRGLDDDRRYPTKDRVGICNRRNVNVWNPKNGKFLPGNFSARSLNGQKTCKQKLQSERGLSDNLNI